MKAVTLTVPKTVVAAARAYGVQNTAPLVWTYFASSPGNAHDSDIIRPRDWILSDEEGQGRDYMAEHRFLLKDGFKERLALRGPGLLAALPVGILAAKAAEALGWGVENAPHEHLIATTLAVHHANLATHAAAEVFVNRYMKHLPYDFVTEAKAQDGVRYIFERRQGLGQGVLASIGRHYKLEESFWKGVARGAGTTVFKGAILGAGPGRLFSALADKGLDLCEAQGWHISPTTRHVVSTAAFFAPDVLQIALGSKASFLSGTAFRVAALVFSAGYAADLTTMLYSRASSGLYYTFYRGSYRDDRAAQQAKADAHRARLRSNADVSDRAFDKVLSGLEVIAPVTAQAIAARSASSF